MYNKFWISASPSESTSKLIREETERREQSGCCQQEGKQMLTLLLLPKNAHPHNLLPFSWTHSRFSSSAEPPHPQWKGPECVCMIRWWILKKWSNKIGLFFFCRKTRNEALCRSTAVAHLTGLAWLLLCQQHKGDWEKTQTASLCCCGAWLLVNVTVFADANGL